MSSNEIIRAIKTRKHRNKNIFIKEGILFHPYRDEDDQFKSLLSEILLLKDSKMKPSTNLMREVIYKRYQLKII